MEATGIRCSYGVKAMLLRTFNLLYDPGFEGYVSLSSSLTVFIYYLVHDGSTEYEYKREATRGAMELTPALWVS